MTADEERRNKQRFMSDQSMGWERKSIDHII